MRRSRRRFPKAIAAAGLLALGMWGRSVAADSLAIPAGVRIPVALSETLTSLTSHPGDAFSFRTTADEKLGEVEVPAGTLGHGRVAVAVPAHDKARGTLALQVDSLELTEGTVWVDIDTSHPPSGHLSDKHNRFIFIPLPIGIFPAMYRTQSGNLVLDAGTPFRVITTPPRSSLAPLAGSATPAPASSAPGASPAATATPA